MNKTYCKTEFVATILNMINWQMIDAKTNHKNNFVYY